jgi:hypothetical protein
MTHLQISLTALAVAFAMPFVALLAIAVDVLIERVA